MWTGAVQRAGSQWNVFLAPKCLWCFLFISIKVLVVWLYWLVKWTVFYPFLYFMFFAMSTTNICTIDDSLGLQFLPCFIKGCQVDTHFFICVFRRRVFILGPSHHVALSRCALSTVDIYRTPLYDLHIDQKGKCKTSRLTKYWM